MVFCQRLFDFQKPATFSNMPASFQRLSDNSRKNPGIPGKIGEKSKFLGKNGSKIGKMGYFPNFQEKSGADSPLFIWPVLGLYKGRFPFGGIGVQDGKKPLQGQEGRKNRGYYPPVSL
jgi:hypothetical protein